MPRFRAEGNGEEGVRRTFVSFELVGVEVCYLLAELACQELVIDLKKCPNKMPYPVPHSVLKYPRWYAPV